jgi:hypothetical protein
MRNKYVRARSDNSKIKKVMEEFEEGRLYSGKNKNRKVTDINQAIAIGISEQRAYDKSHGKVNVYHT